MRLLRNAAAVRNFSDMSGIAVAVALRVGLWRAQLGSHHDRQSRYFPITCYELMLGVVILHV
jgi:hypothetical protein